MRNNKTAILLINVGTPSGPKVKEVRKFLFQFLNDRRVIDLPWLLQKVLVNLVIVPFRAPGSSEMYKKLWGNYGSPLLYYIKEISEKLQVRTDEKYDVFYGMRYGEPGIDEALSNIRSGRYVKIIVLPLFPQYASSTTGTAVEAVLNNIKKWNGIPEIKTITWFYNHPRFIAAFTTRIKKAKPETYDHIIFSYHSLPLRHIERIHAEKDNNSCSCEDRHVDLNHFCYKSACYETTRLLASGLNLSPESYSVAFQSRFFKNWLAPFTDDTIKKLAAKGKKRVIVVCPSFVSDCLETVVEIGLEYRKMFESLGGETLDLVDSLNDMPEWIEALEDIINDK